MPDWARLPFPLDDPYPAFHAARARAPVQWDAELGAHVVLSHEHALTVLRDPAKWSSDPRNSPERLASMGQSEAFSGMWGESLLMSDPPTHTRLRKAVNRFFTPRAMQEIRGRVTAIVNSALTPLAEGASIELMEELAYPIPLAVIAELFDVGLEGAELLREQTPTLARMLELDPTPEELEKIGAAAMSVMLFLVPLVAERQVNPGKDLLSTLIHSPDGGTALKTEEIISMCLLLLAAGHETTANLIGNGTLALLENPDQLEWLAGHPEESTAAVEELLRYDSPVQVASRIARDDLLLGGVEVRKGQQALVMLGSANRDPACHDDPDRLDLKRKQAGHLAFGNGPHYCVGAGLARLEAQETFRVLAKLLHRPGIAGNWSYHRDRSRTFRRLRELNLPSTSATALLHTLDTTPIT